LHNDYQKYLHSLAKYRDHPIAKHRLRICSK